MSRSLAAHWAGNIALLLGSIICTLGALEVGLRVTGLSDSRPTPPPMYQQSGDSEISYELKQNMAIKAFRNTVTTNSLGFRSPEIVPEKPLFAVLGDSITFGYGVGDDETLPRRIEAHLGGRYQFLNTGVPGYTIGQEAATYRRKVASLAPAGLIVVFYWNDLEIQDAAVLAPDGNVVPTDQPWNGVACAPVQEGILGYVPGRCWLDLHSSLYRAIRKFVTQRTGQRALIERTTEAKSTPFTEAIPVEKVDIYEKTFDALAKSLPPAMPKLFVIRPEKALHFTYRPRLRAMAEARGFKVLDLYEVFGNEAQTLGWDTVHPSPKTLDQAASVIAAVLEEWKLLPTQR